MSYKSEFIINIQRVCVKRAIVVSKQIKDDAAYKIKPFSFNNFS